jgi:hypothetical protein
MSGQIPFRSITLAAPLLVWGVGIAVPANTARADECLTAPNSAAPKGSHWYYHTDRAKHRKCWFLRALEYPTQLKAVRGTSATAPAAHVGAVEKPATAPAGAHRSMSADGSAAPLRLPPAQPTPASSATMVEPVQQSVQGSTAPPIPEALAPQASTSSQISTQAAAPAPAAAIVWPDPPAVALVKAQQPDIVRRDARSDSVLPTMDARKPIASGGTARSRASTAHAAKMAAPPAGTLVELLLAVALGLTMAGLLYRFLLIPAGRGRQIVIDHSESDCIDNRHEHELRDDRQQHGSVDARERFIDDSHLSLVPAASDYTARRPLRGDDEWQNNALHKGRASQITDDVSEREKTLAQLIRDLDQLLQSRKGA